MRHRRFPRSTDPAVAPNPGAAASERPRSDAARPPVARRFAALFASFVVLGTTAGLALAPSSPAPDPAAVALVADGSADTVAEAVQSIEVHDAAALPGVAEESYVASTGTQTLVAGGTNLDWAKLVLIEGDWPVTEENVTFMMRWMRQENGADNWWNRNNPLNNGQGSGGGSGLGSYPDLAVAAYYAAENLRSGRYPAVDAALQRGDSADATAQAIWASPWASSHYGYGTHWSSRPYDVIEAPAEAWGR
ncbi:hypothetical protein ACFOE1_08705 [Agromyces mediolanus]|uniref:Uncharacterized protein n=1 Tax=Agromyces mediolanus TaxID=41986 RepID=A0A918CDE0_AGRME|nr:hypothetical protein [Agromyces mediolanus]GGR18448.1 hypothetical protein GCM10010196_09440 [Agromyces mediolanus]GLJ71442.1 hypothetical protein GCM10017583_06980 [Agromyces mediolanus]